MNQERANTATETDQATPTLKEPVQTQAQARKEARQRLFLAALARVGTITRACEVSDVPYRTYYDWAKEPAFKERFDDATAQHADRMEQKLFDILDAIDPSKPPNPAYVLGTLNALKPDKYRQTVIDTTEQGKSVMEALREHARGKKKSGKREKQDTEVVQELVEKIKRRRGR